MNTTTQDRTAHLTALEDEIALLDELSTLSADARDAALEPGTTALAPILERKTEIIGALAQRREARARMLSDAGHTENDLLVFLLGAFPKEEHSSVVALMSRYVDTQEKTAEAINHTRDFFETALDLVTEMREALVPRDETTTYDLHGVTEAPVIPIALSQLT